MHDRINPRPIFRKFVAALQEARCPECGLGYMPWGSDESRHCGWCARRQIMVGEYQAWYQQDQQARTK